MHLKRIELCGFKSFADRTRPRSGLRFWSPTNGSVSTRPGAAGVGGTARHSTLRRSSSKRGRRRQRSMFSWRPSATTSGISAETNACRAPSRRSSRSEQRGYPSFAPKSNFSTWPNPPRPRTSTTSSSPERDSTATRRAGWPNHSLSLTLATAGSRSSDLPGNRARAQARYEPAVRTARLTAHTVCRPTPRARPTRNGRAEAPRVPVFDGMDESAFSRINIG